MDKKYIELGIKLETLLEKIDKTLDAELAEKFEDVEMYRQLEVLQMVLAKYINTNNYLQKPTAEGKLYKNKNGRYVINDTELTCGDYLEIFNKDEQAWYLGRIEHSQKLGYYHSNQEGSISLREGMLARIR